MNDRELLALMCASLYDGAMKEALVSDHAAAIAVLHARSILSEIDKSPAPEAGSDSASPSLTAVKRYENIDRAAKRVLSVFDVARSPHGAPSRVVEPDGATDALCALMDAVEGFAPPSRAETPTEADCAEAWYTAGTITCPEGLVRRTTTAGREITLSAQTWVRIAAVRALCLTSRPEGMDAAPLDYDRWLDGKVCTRDPGGDRGAEWIRGWNECIDYLRIRFRVDPPAPPPVARETTSLEEYREAWALLCEIAFDIDHGDYDGEARDRWMEKWRAISDPADAARSSLPSGEAGVDVERLVNFVRSYVSNRSAVVPEPGARVDPVKESMWAAEQAVRDFFSPGQGAQCSAQGVPTRAKGDGGGE